MKPSHSSEHHEPDREIIEILKELGSFKSTYPPELLDARRAAFLSQLDRLGAEDTSEEWAAEDQELVNLLGVLKSVKAEYPPDLLAARRAALLRHMERVGSPSVLDKLRDSFRKIFQSKTAFDPRPPSGLGRISLAVGSLIAAVLIGYLFFIRPGQSFTLLPSQIAAVPQPLLPTSPGEVTMVICNPQDHSPSCPPGELDPNQDLADQGNGTAQPAISSQTNPEEVHRAAYVNDGRGGASWVSNSNESWIKIDLGKITIINTVSLRKGSPGPSNEHNPGQFVIAVALSDVYADGDSSKDDVEYAQVFRSEQTGFSGTVLDMETIKTRFPLVQARFVKITFEQAGAAIEEIGVFMVQPPVLAEQPTLTPYADLPGITFTAVQTNTPSSMPTVTSVAADTRLPTDTAVPSPTDTLTPLPTNTPPAVDTPTPVPTVPLPSDTPIPPAVQPSPATTDPIIVSGSDQTLTFTCNGGAVEIRGNTNTVTLLGSCSSITVTGSRNLVFWESGSPVIINRGNNNIVQQL